MATEVMFKRAQSAQQARKKKKNKGTQGEKYVRANPLRMKGKTRGGKFTASVAQDVTEKEVFSSKLQANIPLIVDPDNLAFNTSMLAIASFLLQKGYVGSYLENPDAQASPAVNMLAALNWVLSAIQSVALGATVNISEVPQFLNVILEAVKPKTIPFKSAAIAYSWSQQLVLGLDPVSDSGFSKWAFGDVTDTDQYNDLMTLITPQAASPHAWNKLVKYIEQFGSLANPVAPGTTEVMTGDASIFARQFNFNGTGFTQTGVWYGDVESEIPVRCPMISKFVFYDNQTLRVSRCLMPSSADSLCFAGLPLMEDFKYREYRNKYPMALKCIDFEEIYGYLASWMAQGKTKYLQSLTNSGSDPVALALPFTQQDFRIVLRQALMAFFSTQHMVQFLQPRQFSGNDNGFVPFVAGFNCYGDPTFSGLLIPQLLQENLAALKMRSYHPPVKFEKAKNVLRYVPVLGRFRNDVPAAFQFINDAVGQDLFLLTPQTEIKIIDCTIGNTFVCANNTYYQNVMTSWNDQVENLSQWVTAHVAIGSDNGPPGMALLTTTRYQLNNTQNQMIKHGASREPLPMRYLVNKPLMKKELRRESVGKNGKKQVIVVEEVDKQALPPATLSEIVTTKMSTVRKLTDEELSLYQFLVLPVQRVDEQNALDPLSIAMCQVESIEANSFSFATKNVDGTIGGVSSFNRLVNASGLCVTGTAGAVNSTYAALIKKLTEEGEAGMLADLLGGFVKKAIPGSAGIVDTVAQMVPF